MEKYEKLWVILKCTAERWMEDTPKDKQTNEKKVYEDLIEYMNCLEVWHETKENTEEEK